jgi:hypothetical protein
LFTDLPEPEDTKPRENDSEVVGDIKEILNTRFLIFKFKELDLWFKKTVEI